MRRVAFIPARGGSKSIPWKNIRPLAGKPLLHWTCQAALDSCVDEVYVSTDSERIRQSVLNLSPGRLHVIDRSPATATDQATTESALLEFAARVDFDQVVLIQATSPLLRAEDIDGAFAVIEAERGTSALSVTRQHRFRWTHDSDGGVVAENYQPADRPRRQDWSGELFENGAFYITSREALLESGCRLSGKTLAWEMNPDAAVELDEPHDWVYVEALLRRRESGDRLAPELARRIKLLATDCDGVLTDAGMYYGTEGELMKKFSTRDGMGLRLFREAGGQVALLTGEDSPIAAARAAKLGIEHVFLHCGDKKSTLISLCARLGIHLSEVAFIGDDLNDLEVLHSVGLPACPADAAKSVREVAQFVSTKEGGAGCVRELVDAILEASGS